MTNNTFICGLRFNLFYSKSPPEGIEISQVFPFYLLVLILLSLF